MRRLSGKEKIKILFVRPPHHYWPIINESDNFLVPLNYPTLAAWLRSKLDFVEIEILDCCVEHIGFHSLGEEIKRRRPDVVGIGECVCYAHDALRVFDVAKSINPDIVTIGGSHIFSHAPEWALKSCKNLDYIIRFEAEIAMEHFFKVARAGGNEEETLSLCWLDDSGNMKTSPLGPAIENLDEIPPAAFDLLLMDKYSPFGKLWQRAATIQRSRGCIDTCNFCSWIAMENRHVENPDGAIHDSPFYRTKSPGKVLEEIDILYNQYGVRYLFWVDATWNMDNKWLTEFCEGIIQRKYKLGWWAFIRYDLLISQHESGVLDLMVKAGLRHALIGLERSEPSDLLWLNKNRYSEETAVKAFHILRDHYPQVFRQATILTGIRTDTAESIKGLLKFAHDCDLDFAAFHVCTPFPGTPLHREATEKGWIEETDFSNYDMFYPTMPTEHLSREDVAYWTIWCQKNFVAKKPLRYLSRMFSPHIIRRRLHWWFFLSIGRVIMTQLWNAAIGKERFEGFAGVNKLWKPTWYEE